jgi:hypothetical protein
MVSGERHYIIGAKGLLDEMAQIEQTIEDLDLSGISTIISGLSGLSPQDIENERNARISGDAFLQSEIDALKTSQVSGDAYLQTQIALLSQSTSQGFNDIRSEVYSGQAYLKQTMEDY